MERLLQADKQAATGRDTYDDVYFERFFVNARPILEQQTRPVHLGHRGAHHGRVGSGGKAGAADGRRRRPRRNEDHDLRIDDPHILKSLNRQFLVAVACLALFVTSPAAAQQPLASPPTSPQFLSRYDFHLSAAALANDDQRFSWDTHFGGDIDVVDYVYGRIDDGHGLRGGARQRAPRRSIPIRGTTSSRWRRPTASNAPRSPGFFHHVSRHLSDRPKDDSRRVESSRRPRASARRRSREPTIDMVADFGGTTQQVNVDYRLVGQRRRGRPASGSSPRLARLRPRHRALDERRPAAQGRASATAHADRRRGGRRAFGLIGEAAVGEFFVGYERRFDAYPLGFEPERWFMVGFRVRSAIIASMRIRYPRVRPRRALLLAASVFALASLTPSAAIPAQQDRVSARHASQRPDGRAVRGSLDADRARPALVSRRLEKREAGPDRVRAPVRAPDVQGLEERSARRAHLDDFGPRRPEQRLHDRRRDGVLGDAAGAGSAARPVARGRSHGHAQDRQGNVRQRAGRGERGAAAAGGQPAVRPV